MTNTNLETGIPFGIIAAKNLDPDLFDKLQQFGTDVHFEAWKADLCADLRRVAQDHMSNANINELINYAMELCDDFYDDEPVHEGEHDGVKYRTTWLGGAPLVWIFESPVVGRYAPCSPCVPGAGDLDTPREDGIECYDVPAEWRA